MAIVCYWLSEKSVGCNTVCLEIQVAELQEATLPFLLVRKLIVSPHKLNRKAGCVVFTIYSISCINTPPQTSIWLAQSSLGPFQFIIMYFQLNSCKV